MVRGPLYALLGGVTVMTKLKSSTAPLGAGIGSAGDDSLTEKPGVSIVTLAIEVGQLLPEFVHWL